MLPLKVKATKLAKIKIIDTQSSFHGRLWARATTSLPDTRKNRGSFTLPDPKGWPGVVTRLFGQGIVFAGGLVAGVAWTLMRKGEPITDRPGLLFAAGVACLVVSVAWNFRPRGEAQSGPSAAQG